jgi:hypothetical protein
MATIIILIGSILGLVGGLTALVGFDASFLTALSIWIAAGPAAALGVILLAAVIPNHRTDGPILAEVA